MVSYNVSVIYNIPCRHFHIFQSSHMFTPHCVYSRKLLSIISRAQWHWISTKVRCGLDSFQKVNVTALKVVAPLLAAFLQHYYTIGNKKMRDEKNSWLPKIHCTCLRALKKVLTAMCSSGTTPLSLPLSLPCPIWLYFWEGPSQSEEYADKGWQAGERPGKHHSLIHPHINTLWRCT